MAKTIGEQCIPGEYMYPYEAVLRPQGPLGKAWVYLRYPFGLPRYRKTSVHASAAQKVQRAFFRRSADCYNCQPYIDGVEPPELGPRTRGWWFDDAVGSGKWYYTRFIEKTIDEYIKGNNPDWCIQPMLGLGVSSIGSISPNRVYKSECYVRGGTYEGNEWIGFGKCLPDHLPYCIMGLQQKDGSTLGTVMTVRVWRVDGLWEDDELTWNNHPEILEQLSATTLWWPALPYGSTLPWVPPRSEIKIPVPKDVTSFAFKLEIYPENILLMYRKECGGHDGYTLMSV